MALKTDFKDYIKKSANKKYAVTDNGDGTYSYTDKTEYSQVGDSYGAEYINATNKQVNKNTDQITQLKDSLNKHIIGFKRQRSNANYATRNVLTDDAVGETKVTLDLTTGVANFGSFKDLIEEVCRPVMVKFDGTVDYELNHDNTTFKLDGVTASDIDNVDYEGNMMVEFRKYRYTSRQTIGDYDYVRFATYKVDDTYEDNAFVNDNGLHCDSFFFSGFEGGLDSNNKLRSIADMTVMVSKNAATEMSYAKANGTGWNTATWSQLNYIWDLLSLIGCTDGFQEVYGSGISSVSAAVATGLTKAKGCFYGLKSGAAAVRTLWIENLWGNVWTRIAGMINDNGTYKVKLTGPYPTPTDSASTYSDYINTGLSTPDNGYIKEANCSENGFLPTAVGGSASTYFCDYFYKNDSGVKYVRVGGYWADGSECGRCVLVNNAASVAGTSLGSRLSYTS